ncbi:MAG: hypothetical protein IK126_06640 [Bacteroidales bacterium]|nr:hypothetical protein [Bacteroidales bacterium]
MKKTILFTILAMGLQCAAAQSTGFYLNSSFPSLGKGIIRENNIVYYEDNFSHYFAYIPSFLYTDPATTTNYKCVQLPENWVVMDFHVLDGIAYFCGVDMGDTSALLGHFVISELFHYPLQVHFHRDVNIAYKLKILHRIVVNTDKTTISMMAIGNTKMQNNLWEACSDVVLYIDDYGAASGCLFFGDDYDVFWDVVSTENYFVVVGTLGNVISGGVKDLTMRRIPFGTPWTGFLPPFEIRYSYDCVHTFAGGVRASAIDKDRIVVAEHYKYDTSIYSVVYKRIGTQVSTIDVSSAQMLYNQWSKQLYPVDVSFFTPRDMVFMKDSMALMMIDSLPYLSGGGIIRLDPCSTAPLYVPQYYFHDNSFQVDAAGVIVEPPHGEQKPYYSLAALSTSSCVAAANSNWLVLDFNTTPMPYYAVNCVGSYTTDFFKCPLRSEGPYVSGIVYPYSMEFVNFPKNIEDASYYNCVHDNTAPSDK